LDFVLAIYSVLFGYYPKIELFDATSYRILYIHVPLSWNMYFAFTLTFVFSLLFLVKSDPKYDAIAFCSAMLGLLYGFAGLVSGMLWAKEVWGYYWSWDPRQTTTLIALLSYLGYIALRTSIPDVEKMRTISSVFDTSAYVTIPIGYLSAVTLRSLHTQLPHQPLGSDAYVLLVLKVVTSFAVFLALLRVYYLRYLAKEEE
jgi:heme exporter protein C